MTLDNKNHGFSLVEVLIALVILSVGMLGVLTLQVKSLQFSQSAQINTNVVNAAADIADRIRANGVAGPAYVSAFTDNTGALGGPLCADTVDGPASGNCGIAEIAAFDLWQWKQQLTAENGIPKGQGRVEYESLGLASTGATNTYTITINWNERGQLLTYALEINH